MSDSSAPITSLSLADTGKIKPQELRALIMELSKWRHAQESGVYLIVASLSATLSEDKRPGFLVDSVMKAIGQVANRRKGGFYQVSPCDYAILIKTSELSLLSMLRDVKVEIMRAVERHAVGISSTIDQGRLVSSYDLTMDYRSAAARIAKYTEAEQAPKDEHAKKRGLSEGDIHKVLMAYQKFGTDKFVTAFVKSQPVMARDAGGFSRKITEFYFSIDLIRKPLFVDVDMRGSGRLFNEFTLTLDMIMLGAYRLLPKVDEYWSLNLNVESMFTEPFEDFIAAVPQEKLKTFFVEFRQANIMENFDEFQVAQSLLKSKGIGIIVDQVFPLTTGLVNLSELGANYCKIHWQDGSEETLKQRKRAITYMRENNVTPILARVDAERAFSIGTELGIDLFQGHLVDDLQRKLAA